MPGNLSFEESQKNFERVSDAYSRKEQYFYMKCRSKEIPEETFGNMFLRVFKKEETNFVSLFCFYSVYFFFSFLELQR